MYLHLRFWFVVVCVCILADPTFSSAGVPLGATLLIAMTAPAMGTSASADSGPMLVDPNAADAQSLASAIVPTDEILSAVIQGKPPFCPSTDKYDPKQKVEIQKQIWLYTYGRLSVREFIYIKIILPYSPYWRTRNARAS